MRVARAFILPPLLVAAAMSASCGYTLAGRGSFLPASIKVIGIPLFTNTTAFYQVEQVLTEKVRTEFIGRGKYKVLPQDTGVDAVLKGEVSSVTVTPTALNEQQQATRYLITVTAKVEFTDAASNKVLWQNPGLSVREEYEVTNATSAVDPSAFFGQEANALDRVATDFARSVVSAILEAF
jgi:hypothetical protein